MFLLDTRVTIVEDCVLSIYHGNWSTICWTSKSSEIHAQGSQGYCCLLEFCVSKDKSSEKFCRQKSDKFESFDVCGINKRRITKRQEDYLMVFVSEYEEISWTCQENIISQAALPLFGDILAHDNFNLHLSSTQN